MMLNFKVSKKYLIRSFSEIKPSDGLAEKVSFILPFIKTNGLRMTYHLSINYQKQFDSYILTISTKVNLLKLTALYLICSLLVSFLLVSINGKLLIIVFLMPFFVLLFVQNLFQLRKILENEIERKQLDFKEFKPFHHKGVH